MKTSDCKYDLSIIVPVKDEELTIRAFLEAVMPECEKLGVTFEILFVNDGSKDRTQAILEEYRLTNPHLSVIKLSRNFGKEYALTAGIDYCRGRAAIPMDVDLQDPVELIPQLYKKHLEGFDSVLAVRKSRVGDSWSRRFMANSFHRAFRRLSEFEINSHAGDFRLISRDVIESIKQMPERTRFMKGILSWPGFSVTEIEYDRPTRDLGESKWHIRKLWALALDGLFSFSTLPLRIWTYVGGFIAFGAVLYLLYTVIKTLVFGVDTPGYASLMSVILLIGGVNLIGIGVLGEYIGRVFVEVKGRPIYIVEEALLSNPDDFVAQDTQSKRR